MPTNPEQERFRLVPPVVTAVEGAAGAAGGALVVLFTEKPIQHEEFQAREQIRDLRNDISSYRETLDELDEQHLLTPAVNNNIQSLVSGKRHEIQVVTDRIPSTTFVKDYEKAVPSGILAGIVILTAVRYGWHRRSQNKQRPPRPKLEYGIIDAK